MSAMATPEMVHTSLAHSTVPVAGGGGQPVPVMSEQTPASSVILEEAFAILHFVQPAVLHSVIAWQVTSHSGGARGEVS